MRDPRAPGASHNLRTSSRPASVGALALLLHAGLSLPLSARPQPSTKRQRESEVMSVAASGEVWQACHSLGVMPLSPPPVFGEAPCTSDRFRDQGSDSDAFTLTKLQPVLLAHACHVI